LYLVKSGEDDQTLENSFTFDKFSSKVTYQDKIQLL
jgi:hypothetical protein